ncbi:MAG: 30S ribosomal protein S20 [Gammaproteobacteria bacterium]|nr:30S ribosomal protein S20 [Gammaproteobacteria bacterium]
MANTLQAKKRVRQAEKHRQLNVDQRSSLRTSVKKAVQAIASGDKTRGTSAYKDAVSELDTTARKGLIHKNKAARHKSRLNTRLHAL